MALNTIDPDHYEQQLDAKKHRLLRLFKPFEPPELEVFSSPPLHFRVRAEFRLWHQDDELFYAMFKKEQPKVPCRIEQFPIGSKCINQLMPQLLNRIKESTVLRHKLFQVEFLTTLSGQALITLIYHKKLDQHWQHQARELSQQLNVQIIGRSKKQRVVLGNDYVMETLTVANKQYQFQQVENSFTQPNAIVNQHMLSWALQHSKHIGSDLVELYCGNGNFTIVLAQNFNRVLATEISKTSVKSAHHNLELNSVENVDVVRMSSEEFSQALSGTREFRRLREVDLASYHFNTVLVDPPRAGLDEATEQLVSRFDNIIYISCNPNTLSKNLQVITKTHTIKHFALFDQFPYTDHIECGVILSKRTR